MSYSKVLEIIKEKRSQVDGRQKLKEEEHKKYVIFWRAEVFSEDKSILGSKPRSDAK